MPIRSRDREILEHLLRHRLATREFLRRVFFPEGSVNAVGKVLTRLAQNDWVREHELQHGFRYVVLGQRGRREVSADRRACWRFTEQSFPLAYAITSHCLTHNHYKLSGPEFEQQFPELVTSPAESVHYFVASTEGRVRLARPLLDRGSPPPMIFRRIDRIARRAYRRPVHYEMIQQDRFSVTILTAWPSKQRYLTRAIQQTQRGPLHVDVHCVPELQRFFPRE